MGKLYPFSTRREKYIVVSIDISGDRALFLFFSFIKTLSLNTEKHKLMYLNQNPPRKIPQALQDQEINPLQHGISFGMISDIS